MEKAGRETHDMTAHEIDDIAGFARFRGPLMGLDLGTKTIGVAVSDGLRLTATGIETIRRKKFQVDAARLADLIAERGISGLVLGLPRNMNGSEGPRCQAVRAFAQNFLRVRDMPIALWDERLSTAAAERALLEADCSRKRRAEVVDAVAAAYILQGALDRLAGIARQEASKDWTDENRANDD